MSESTTVRAKFSIMDWQEESYEEPESGPKLTRVKIIKRYRGVIDGDGVTEMLTAQGAAGAGYVASERISGTLDGRAGSFVIQHSGVADGPQQSTHGVIVPGSGTGELADLRGQAFENEQEVLTLVIEPATAGRP